MTAKYGYIGYGPDTSPVVVAKQVFSPTGVQTNFTFASGYQIGYVDLYLNGVRQIEGQDFSATDTSIVGLTSAAQSGDVLELVAYKAYNLAAPSAVGNFSVSGNLTVTGNSTIIGNESVSTLVASTAIGIKTTSPIQPFQVGSGTSIVVVDSIGELGIGTTNPTSKLTVVGDASISGLTTTNNLYVAGVATHLSSGLIIRNPANTFGYTIAGGAIGADYTLTLPTVTSNTGIAVTGLAQTFTSPQTFTSGLTASGGAGISFPVTSASITANALTIGAISLGGPSQTGGITLGLSTATSTLGIATGVSGVGITKTINFGTGGGSGSFTQINIGPGPSAGVGTVVINSGTNLGIGTTTPAVSLDVIGGIKGTITTGIATTSGAGLSTSFDFTGIPSWVKQVTVMFNGVSTNGTSIVQVQLGAGSPTTSGYNSGYLTALFSSVGSAQITSGIPVGGALAATSLFFGNLIITNLTANTWTAVGNFCHNTGRFESSSGQIALSGTLDRVRITTVNGTDTFDAGSVNILYEG